MTATCNTKHSPAYTAGGKCGSVGEVVCVGVCVVCRVWSCVHVGRGIVCVGCVCMGVIHMWVECE